MKRDIWRGYNMVKEAYYARDKKHSVAYIPEISSWVAWITGDDYVHLESCCTQDEAYKILYKMENIIGWYTLVTDYNS